MKNTTLRYVTFFDIYADNSEEINNKIKDLDLELEFLKRKINSLIICNIKDVCPDDTNPLEYSTSITDELFEDIVSHIMNCISYKLVIDAQKANSCNIPLELLPDELQKEFVEFEKQFSEKIKKLNIKF